MVNRMLGGESVLSLAQETSVPEQTLHRWKHQALVNQGLRDGVGSSDSAQLRAANKRIKALEKELQLVKEASELFDAAAVVPTKEARASLRTLQRAAIRSFLPPGCLGLAAQYMVWFNLMVQLPIIVWSASIPRQGHLAPIESKIPLSSLPVDGCYWSTLFVCPPDN
jgi:transposase-like protein